MCISCQDDSHEKPSFIFSEKVEIEKKIECRLQQFYLAPKTYSYFV